MAYLGLFVAALATLPDAVAVLEHPLEPVSLLLDLQDLLPLNLVLLVLMLQYF